MDCIGCKQPSSSDTCVRFKAVLSELTKGSENGCPRCLFALALVDCIREQLGTTKQLAQITVSPGQTGYAMLAGFNLPGENQTLVDIFTTKGQERNPLGIHRIGRRLPANTRAPETIDALKTWIHECETLHEPCKQRKERSYFHPKRLLDLNNDAVFLREDARPDKYACLSHCWGANAYAIITKTLGRNIHMFTKEGVSWGSLSKTFRDAISVCRSLGIFYLWIDSFCIIQDSAEDWRDQAAQMADIYENAFITIAATWASDGSRGLFANVPLIYRGFPVSGYNDTFARLMIPSIPSQSNRSDPNWPLLNRGWIYQEMRLSPRVVHFCYHEVAWNCQASSRSQSGQNSSVIDDGTASYNDIMPEGPKRDLAELWHHTVNEYSGLLLTYETDRMVALSALTQRMGTMRGNDHGNDRYLVGLWESTLVKDLHWMVVPVEISATPKNWAFPSWSWASVASRVMFMFGYSTKLDAMFVEVEDIQYQAEGPSHLGRFTEAKITLRAPLIDCTHDMTKFVGRILWASKGENWAVTEEIEVSRYVPDYAWDGPAEVPQDFNAGPGWSYIIPTGLLLGKPPTFCGLYVKKRGGNDVFYERLGIVNFTIVGGEQLAQEERVGKVIAAIERFPRRSITLV